MDEVATYLQEAGDKLSAEQEALPSTEEKDLTEKATNKGKEDTSEDTPNEEAAAT